MNQLKQLMGYVGNTLNLSGVQLYYDFTQKYGLDAELEFNPAEGFEGVLKDFTYNLCKQNVHRCNNYTRHDRNVLAQFIDDHKDQECVNIKELLIDVLYNKLWTYCHDKIFPAKGF